MNGSVLSCLVHLRSQVTDAPVIGGRGNQSPRPASATSGFVVDAPVETCVALRARVGGRHGLLAALVRAQRADGGNGCLTWWLVSPFQSCWWPPTAGLAREQLTQQVLSCQRRRLRPRREYLATGENMHQSRHGRSAFWQVQAVDANAGRWAGWWSVGRP